MSIAIEYSKLANSIFNTFLATLALLLEITNFDIITAKSHQYDKTKIKDFWRLHGKRAIEQ